MFGKNADSAIMMRVELLTKLLRQSMQVAQAESKCTLYQHSIANKMQNQAQTKHKIWNLDNAKSL